MRQRSPHPQRPELIALEGKKALVLSNNHEDEARQISLEIANITVGAAHSPVHQGRPLHEFDLLHGGVVNGQECWQPLDAACASVGRDHSEQWAVPGRPTVFVRVDAGAAAVVAYAWSGKPAAIPLVADEDYCLEGYFGSHRCLAALEIDLLDGAGAIIAQRRCEIRKASGGTTLDGYARAGIAFHAPATARAAHVRIQIDASEAAAEKLDGYLFFVDLTLCMTGSNGSTWRPSPITDATMVTLQGGKAVTEISLPRLPSTEAGAIDTRELIDTEDGAKTEPAQLHLPLTLPLQFVPDAFDGVTLAGRVLHAAGNELVELLIDGVTAGRLDLPGTAEVGKARNITIRIPDAFLDGCPHVVELRETASATRLFINAAILKAFITPWESLIDFARVPFPADLHPMARRRYQNLVAHLQSVADEASGISQSESPLRRIAHAYKTLAGRHDEQANSRIFFSKRTEPQVALVLYAPKLEPVYSTIAALVLAYNRTPYCVTVCTGAEADEIARFKKRVSGVEILSVGPEASRAMALNRAIASISTPFVALMTTASEPHAYWLDEFVRAFTLFDDVGCVGAKVVAPNGRLLGAGGILRASGALQPVTSGGNAEHPQVNYARQVDYFPCHAILISRAAWLAAGGLSEDIGNEDLEDADLALKIREQGRRLVYVPAAAVAMTPSPRHSAPGPHASAAFRRKWARPHGDPGGDVASIAMVKDRGVSGRVLMIDQQTPRPDNDAGSYAAVQEMRLLQALGYKVSFMPMNLAYAGAYTQALQRAGIEAIYAPFATSVEETLSQRGDEFDLVYLTRYQTARAVLPQIRKHCPRAKVIFNNADLHFLRELRAAIDQKDGSLLRRSKLTREHELEVMRQVDLALSYSDAERAVIQSHNLDATTVARAPWVVVPHASTPPFGSRRDIAFLGGFGHLPNVEAVKFFIAEVMPILRSTLPGVSFNIFGSQMPPQILSLRADDVAPIGHVQDLAQAMDTARIFVAPLTFGAGVKGKVLSAMAAGLPSILSPVASEGLGAIAGAHFLSAETAQEWAGQITALYGDEVRWNELSRNALMFVTKHYSIDQGLSTMRRALEAIQVYPPGRPTALHFQTTLPPLL
jgi:glycosyltransferase involved in cell wall biosynthesis